MSICSICSGGKIKNYHFKEGFVFLRCLNCGFIWVDVSGINLFDYYNNPDYLHDKAGKGYVDYEADKAPMLPVYLSLLNKIKTYDLPSLDSTSRRGGRPTTYELKRLLDLGAASGYFLDVAGRSGYSAEGIEINPSAVKEGQARGRKIKIADILKSGYPDNTFDSVTAFDFFEHLPHDKLKDYLSAIRKMLAPGGVLAVITVNTASRWAKIFGRKWHTFLPPEHISYFSDKNIRSFLEKNGFEILEIKTVHKRFSLQYIFNFLYRWQGVSLWLSITRFLEKHPRLGTFSLWLPIGDNMLVLARKRS